MPEWTKQLNKKISELTPHWTKNQIIPNKLSISFIRPDFEYGDVSYDQHRNKKFAQEAESFWYNAPEGTTVAIRPLPTRDTKKNYDKISWFKKFLDCFVNE